MDGELDDEEAHALLTHIGEHPELHDHWRAYHLIGDSLRGEAPFSEGFASRFAERLAQEPTVVAPHPRKVIRSDRAVVAWSMAASVAAISLVAWAAFQISDRTTGPDKMVAQQTVPANPGEIPPASVNPYLLAHEEFSPGVVMQGVTPYIRAVNEQQDGAK
jgi:sigma-E factor negative regulatory protein RseA